MLYSHPRKVSISLEWSELDKGKYLLTMVTSPSFKTFRGGPSGAIEEGIYAGRELKPNEVLIRITCSGVCGTDLHLLKSGMVLGHEGVGVVESFGEGTKGNWKV